MTLHNVKCRKLDGKGGLLQILLCPAAASGGDTRAAASAAADQSAGPSLEGLGLTSAPGTRVESPQRVAADGSAVRAATADAPAAAADGGNHAQAAAAAALPPSIAAVVREEGLTPVPVKVIFTTAELHGLHWNYRAVEHDTAVMH